MTPEVEPFPVQSSTRTPRNAAGPSVTGLYLPREVFFGRLVFAGAFVPVCASDFGRFFPATSGSFRLMCSRWDTSDRGYPVPVRFAMTWSMTAY